MKNISFKTKTSTITVFVILLVFSCLVSNSQTKPQLKELTNNKTFIEVSWNNTELSKGKYKVYRSTNEKIFVKVGEVSKNDTSFVDKSIKESGLYYYQIMAQLPDTFFVSNIQEIQVDMIGYTVEENLKSGSINDAEKIEELTEQFKLNVYPTVFSSELNITLDGSVKNLKLFDMSGKKLYSEVVELKKGIHAIQLGHLSKGTYILSADNEPFKVIKE